MTTASSYPRQAACTASCKCLCVCVSVIVCETFCFLYFSPSSCRCTSTWIRVYIMSLYCVINSGVKVSFNEWQQQTTDPTFWTVFVQNHIRFSFKKFPLYGDGEAATTRTTPPVVLYYQKLVKSERDIISDMKEHYYKIYIYVNTNLQYKHVFIYNTFADRVWRCTALWNMWALCYNQGSWRPTFRHFDTKSPSKTLFIILTDFTGFLSGFPGVCVCVCVGQRLTCSLVLEIHVCRRSASRVLWNLPVVFTAI